MPSRPNINDCLRVLLNFHIGGQFAGQTHMDFHINGGFSFNQALADTVVGIIGAALLANNVDDALHTSLTIPEFVVVDLDNNAHDPLFVTSSFVGGETSNLLPANVAALVSLRTGFSGRSNRGRSYWLGYTEASSVGNVFNVTSQTNLESAYEDIQTNIDADTPGSALTVVSFTNATHRDVTSITVEGTWATMRPRLERAR
jgi:hypothetical protein